ncbi:hypothetical protein D3C72_973600 [compost metagenome]
MPRRGACFHRLRHAVARRGIRCGHRRIGQVVQPGFTGLWNPATQEQRLHLPHHRPLTAQQHIDPGRVPCLDAELGVRAILAAAIGDAVVDHHQLAVVAQIHAAERHVAQAAHIIQRGQQLHASLCQLPPQGAVMKGARTERIQHHPALHATACRSRHRLHQALAGIVGQPDVEGDVYLLARLRDVVDQMVDGRLGVGHGLGR